MRLQVMGFMWVFVIFLVCAIAYHDLIKKEYIAVFQVCRQPSLRLLSEESSQFTLSKSKRRALTGKHRRQA